MAIEFTEAAVQRGLALMERKGPGWLRLGVRGGGCSGLSYFMEHVEQRGEKDKTFDFEGLSVCVDRKSYLYVNGTVVDFVDTMVKSGFVYNNPMASKSCSCGESFMV